MIKKKVTRSCCGGKIWVYETDLPVTRAHLDEFLKSGYTTAPHFYKSGIFYINKKTINATCSFGTRKLTVRTSGNQDIINEFETLLEKIVNTK